jgi:hypothetical protein
MSAAPLVQANETLWDTAIWRVPDDLPAVYGLARKGDRAALVALHAMSRVGEQMKCVDPADAPACLTCDFRFRAYRRPVAFAVLSERGGFSGYGAPICGLCFKMQKDDKLTDRLVEVYEQRSFDGPLRVIRIGEPGHA